jgi:hypothetical protein
MNIQYNLKEIYPRVFLITMDNSYDLAMTFCRAQEFYESPYKEIRGKNFNMVEFQRLYTMRRGESCFTYPQDWCGFNIPSNVIYNLYYSNNIKDLNQYDAVFHNILEKIGTSGHDNQYRYYLIGAGTGDERTKNHEVAHAFYYLHPPYKREMNKAIKQINKHLYNKITNFLLNTGYTKKVIDDEIQAYFATGDSYLRDNGIKIPQNITKKFKKVFEEYIE